MVLLVVVNAHTAVTLPAVGDHLGLAALHAAEPALNFTLACEGSGLLLPLPLLPVRLPPGLSFISDISCQKTTYVRKKLVSNAYVYESHLSSVFLLLKKYNKN